MFSVDRRTAAILAALGMLSACGRSEPEPKSGTSPSASGSTRTTPAAAGGVTGADVAVPRPGELTKQLLTPDVLIYSRKPLDRGTIAGLRKLPEVQYVEPISMASFFAQRFGVTYAAVDPATFRRFSPPGTAQTTEVWQRVADGEIAINPRLGRKLQNDAGYLAIGNEKNAPEIHVGAYAQILDPAFKHQIDAVVNSKWIEQLGIPAGNAALVSTGANAPAYKPLLRKFRRLVDANGARAQIVIMGQNLDVNAPLTAVLTGGSVAEAIGTFSYRLLGGGRVAPDPAWVAANIRTEQMPIIGPVTGHRVMLPQLRGALQAVVDRGLAKAIYSFAGCYVPRFIAGSSTLSFHTFGTAVDFNVADNQRGTVGKMDRTVVSIFKQWGFGWGGDWSYTDPMHFELVRLARRR